MLPIVAPTLPDVNTPCFQKDALTDTVSSMKRKSESATRIGARVRALRTDRGMSTKDLAEAIGVTDGYIRAIEVGSKEVATIDLASRLARALNVSIEEIIGSDGESAERRRLREEREKFTQALASIEQVILDPSLDFVADRMDEMSQEDMLKLAREIWERLTPEQRDQVAGDRR